MQYHVACSMASSEEVQERAAALSCSWAEPRQLLKLASAYAQQAHAIEKQRSSRVHACQSPSRILFRRLGAGRKLQKLTSACEL